MYIYIYTLAGTCRYTATQLVDISFGDRTSSCRAACFVYVFFLLYFRWMVDREVLGAYVGGLGPLLGLMLAVLGRSWGLCWRSWAALKAYVGGLGSRSGPMWAVLGADQGLCGRSWLRIRAHVGGPGLLSGRLWAILAALGPSVGGLGAGSGRKVAQTRAGSDLAS